MHAHTHAYLSVVTRVHMRNACAQSAAAKTLTLCNVSKFSLVLPCAKVPYALSVNMRRPPPNVMLYEDARIREAIVVKDRQIFLRGYQTGKEEQAAQEVRCPRLSPPTQLVTLTRRAPPIFCLTHAANLDVFTCCTWMFLHVVHTTASIVFLKSFMRACIPGA